MRIRYAPNVTRPDTSEATSTRTGMLLAIAYTGKHLYQGTVSAHVKAKRRAANKAARAARRAHRKAA